MFDKYKWANFLKELQGDMSSREFSGMLGMNRSTLSLYQNAHYDHRPKYETVEKICIACPHIPKSDIFLAAGFEDLFPISDDVDDLTHRITLLLYEHDLIQPGVEIPLEKKKRIIKFISKCIELSDI